MEQLNVRLLARDDRVIETLWPHRNEILLVGNVHDAAFFRLVLCSVVIPWYAHVCVQQMWIAMMSEAERETRTCSDCALSYYYNFFRRQARNRLCH